MTKRPRLKIAIATGTRAEYGLLRPLIKAVDAHPQCECLLFVCGMHFSPEFGLSIQEIEKDGFPIAARIDCLGNDDDPVAISTAMGKTLEGTAKAIAEHQPDILIVLGDRFEILAVTQAAIMAHVPVGHCHGGERSEGALDECLRHAITKLSSLHFVASEPYRQRVIQMGEMPSTVFTVGANGLETMKSLSLLSREECEKQLGLTFSAINFLVTFHPETCHPEQTSQHCQCLFDALDAFPDATLIMTKSNADETGRDIGLAMETYAREKNPQAKVFANLGSLKYLSVMQHADVIIGNSSSGIIETPAFGKPTVNIGTRQQGRLQANSILNCDWQTDDIIQTIQAALDPDFQRQCETVEYPYGDGDVSKRIIEVILQADLSALKQKAFYDIDFTLA